MKQETPPFSPIVLIAATFNFFIANFRSFGRLITVPLFLFLFVYFIGILIQAPGISVVVGLADVLLTLLAMPFIGVAWIRLALGKEKIQTPFQSFTFNKRHAYYIWASFLILMAQLPFLLFAYVVSLSSLSGLLFSVIMALLFVLALGVGTRLAFLSIFAALDRPLIMAVAWKEAAVRWRDLFIALLCVRVFTFGGILFIDKLLGSAGYPFSKLFLLCFSVLGDYMLSYYYQYVKQSAREGEC